MTQSHFKNYTLIKVALYEPDIPQNTAAIVRLCACFGARLDIIEPCGFFLSDKRFKRVVMDYINKCKIKSFKNFTEFKKDKKNERIILMTTKAKKNISTLNLIKMIRYYLVVKVLEFHSWCIKV